MRLLVGFFLPRLAPMSRRIVFQQLGKMTKAFAILACCGPVWACLGPVWACLGVNLDVLGLNLDVLGLNLDVLGSNLGMLGLNLDVLSSLKPAKTNKKLWKNNVFAVLGDSCF